MKKEEYIRNLTVEKAISKITDSSYECYVAFENTMLVRIHVGWTIEGYILQEIIKEMENDNYNFISIDVNTNDRPNPKLDIIFGKDIERIIESFGDVCDKGFGEFPREMKITVRVDNEVKKMTFTGLKKLDGHIYFENSRKKVLYDCATASVDELIRVFEEINVQL